MVEGFRMVDSNQDINEHKVASLVKLWTGKNASEVLVTFENHILV